MKRIIDGLRYNTGTATNLGGDCYNGSCTDFQWWSTDLYVTKRSHRYFLAGRGGPMSQWSQPIGNNGWGGGEGIRPLSANEAREWAERHLSSDEVEAAFADQIEDA